MMPWHLDFLCCSSPNWRENKMPWLKLSWHLGTLVVWILSMATGGTGELCRGNTVTVTTISLCFAWTIQGFVCEKEQHWGNDCINCIRCVKRWGTSYFQYVNWLTCQALLILEEGEREKMIIIKDVLSPRRKHSFLTWKWRKLLVLESRTKKNKRLVN